MVNYNQKEFCDLIDKYVHRLYSDSHTNEMIWNFIERYPSGVLLHPDEMKDFEEFIPMLSDDFNLNKENAKTIFWTYTDEVKGVIYKDFSNYHQKVNKNFYSAFHNLVSLFIQEKHVPDKATAPFIIWGLIRKVAIRYFSKQFVKMNSNDFSQCKTVEDYYKKYCLNSNQKLEPFETSYFVYYLIHHQIVKANFFVEAIKFGAFLLKYEENVKLQEFKRSLINYKKDLPLVSDKLTIHDIDMMSGDEFEDFLVELLQRMDFIAWKTKKTNDQGLDIIASYKNKNYKIGFQAKCHTGNISNKAVQEITAAVKHYNLDKAIVVTNRYFTRSAIELAASNDVVLWDRDILKDKIRELFSK